MYEQTEIPGVYWADELNAYCWEDFHGTMIGAYSYIEDAAEDLRDYTDELERDLDWSY